MSVVAYSGRSPSRHEAHAGTHVGAGSNRGSTRRAGLIGFDVPPIDSVPDTRRVAVLDQRLAEARDRDLFLRAEIDQRQPNRCCWSSDSCCRVPIVPASSNTRPSYSGLLRP